MVASTVLWDHRCRAGIGTRWDKSLTAEGAEDAEKIPRRYRERISGSSPFEADAEAEPTGWEGARAGGTGLPISTRGSSSRHLPMWHHFSAGSTPVADKSLAIPGRAPSP